MILEMIGDERKQKRIDVEEAQRRHEHSGKDQHRRQRSAANLPPHQPQRDDRGRRGQRIEILPRGA